MTKIIVNKGLLDKKLARAGDADLIELCIVAAGTDGGDYAPAFLHIAAIHNRSEYEDLESIDECPSDVKAVRTA